MKHGSRFTIIYAPEVRRHIAAISAQHHGLIRRTIREQLSHRPAERTRNRKPLEDQPGPFGATWELRCGIANQFRVFYELSQDAQEVWILAIGVKERDRLFIAGEELDP